MNSQPEDDATLRDINNIDISFEEDFLPIDNSTTMEATTLNENEGEKFPDEKDNDKPENKNDDSSDDMFVKIIETLPLNKKVGQLIKKKTKTRTLARCKICDRKISWYQRSQHRKVHQSSNKEPTSNISSTSKKRSHVGESQENSKTSKNNELNSNLEYDTIIIPPDPKRHKGINIYFEMEIMNVYY